MTTLATSSNCDAENVQQLNKISYVFIYCIKTKYCYNWAAELVLRSVFLFHKLLEHFTVIHCIVGDVMVNLLTFINFQIGWAKQLRRNYILRKTKTTISKLGWGKYGLNNKLFWSESSRYPWSRGSKSYWQLQWQSLQHGQGVFGSLFYMHHSQRRPRWNCPKGNSEDPVIV